MVAQALLAGLGQAGVSFVVDDGRVAKVFYPVFPPDRNAADVLAWLQRNPRPPTLR